MIPTLPTRPTFAGLGGAKYDYVDGVIDPDTDRTSDEVNALFATVGGLAQVSPQMLVVISIAGGAASVTKMQAAFAGATAVVAYVGTGSYTLTLGGSVSDLQGNAQTFAPTAIMMQLGDSIAAQVVYTVAGNVISIAVTDSANVLAHDPKSVTVLVF